MTGAAAGPQPQPTPDAGPQPQPTPDAEPQQSVPEAEPQPVPKPQPRPKPATAAEGDARSDDPAASIALADMDPDDVLSRVLPRLMGTSALPGDWRQRFGYGKRLAADLVELLAVDLPEAVTLLTDADVERFGHEALTTAAYDNLRAKPLESHEVIGHGEDGDLHTIEGESHFIASRLLVLEDLLQETVGERIWDFGVVVSMPVPNQLVFHPIQDLGVQEAITAMSTLTAANFDESTGGVSPYVYWWQRGALTQLTELAEDGQPRLIDNAELAATLDELGTLGSD
ncbi:MAG TPA: hypothetical protein VFG63_04150 [Nocardioidaceae bacterium]|nr:hypothetical protein [Nocardioidaceae bacterium]